MSKASVCNIVPSLTLLPGVNGPAVDVCLVTTAAVNARFWPCWTVLARASKENTHITHPKLQSHFNRCHDSSTPHPSTRFSEHQAASSSRLTVYRIFPSSITSFRPKGNCTAGTRLIASRHSPRYSSQKLIAGLLPTTPPILLRRISLVGSHH